MFIAAVFAYDIPASTIYYSRVARPVRSMHTDVIKLRRVRTIAPFFCSGKGRKELARLHAKQRAGLPSTNNFYVSPSLLLNYSTSS